MTQHHSTLVDLLRWRARYEPGKKGYTFLVDGERKEISLTYAELDRRAKNISCLINSLGANGQPLLLMFPSGLEFVAAFFGCLYSGSTAVTVYPPRPNRSLERFSVIAGDSGAKIVLTTESIRAQIEPSVAESEGLDKLQWIATDNSSEQVPTDWVAPNIDEESIALLQYTSGSTAKPNGVIVSHGNILHNLRYICNLFEHTESSVVVGWLPMTHDMGLIGNMLQPLYVGCPHIFMQPEHFLIRPIRWLRAISRFRATSSGGPNFAFDYCAEKIKPELCDGLDLSSWDLAFNGAEQVRHKTIDRFSNKFAQCGFRREAFYPCYGLAESTLIVSGGEKTSIPVEIAFDAAAMGANRVLLQQDDSDNGRTLIGCGQPRLDQRVLIVDPETSVLCADDRIGEIWISGPSVSRGYWKQQEKTRQVFHGYLRDSMEGPYLRSGDLGFLHNSELFVSGRLKDLIIIGGSNHYPVDIETTVEKCHQAIRMNCVAAISVDVRGAERLVIVAEIDRRIFAAGISKAKTLTDHSTLEIDKVSAAIREAVSRGHELSVHAICMIKPFDMPKTASGKIQRHLCRKQYLDGELRLVE